MKFNGQKQMLLSLELARKAALMGEVPVGAIITDELNNVISSCSNRVEELSDPTAHAEILAIREAARVLHSTGNNRLENCTIYVTLEPCAMCASAISQARIGKLVYGAPDQKGGAVENGPKLFSLPYGYKPTVVSGIMEAECSQILKDFFATLR